MRRACRGWRVVVLAAMGLMGCPSLTPFTVVDGASDVTAETGVDVGTDAGSDVGVDTGVDVAVDTGIDAGMDAAIDVVVDTGADVVTDTGVDVVMDSGVDVVTDTGVDVVVDAGVDVAMDAPPIDAGSDAATICDGGTTPCGAACVLVTTDPNNCGACGIVCPANQACVVSSCTVIATPRPTAPLSTAVVTSQQPTLHWSLDATDTGAHVTLCRNRLMTAPCQSFDAPGSAGRPASVLAPGVWFWQLSGDNGPRAGTAVSPVWQFTVGNRSAPVDTSWGTALHDVNGDGFADVVTTSPGSVYVFLGNNTGVRGSPSSPTATLSDPGMSLGAAFAGRPINVGDVDGDGRAEIFVGDAGYNGGAGQAYIYYGTSSGMPGMPFILPVAATSPGAFGQRTVLCDVNGDGWDDAFVTAGSGGGRVYVYYGGPSGLRTTFDVSFRAPTGSGSEFGGGIACAGDTNGDGFADLVVSDRSVGATTMSSTAGMVYVYSGSASGLGSIPTPSVRLSPAPGECYFGQWVASAGDSDGDGYVDLAVTTGSGGTCSDSTSTNHVQIFRGSQTGVTSIVSSDIDMGSTSMGYFGEAQQIAAMDINGDGVGDLAIGQWGGGAAGFAGSVNILLGRTGTGFPATFSQFLSGSSEANFGQLGTGDVDGDGYGDLIVGAFGTDSVFVYRGGAGSAGVSTVPWATLTGSGGFGYYVALRPNSTPTANDPWRRRRAVRTSHAGDEVGSQLACPPVPLEIIRVTRHG